MLSDSDELTRIRMRIEYDGTDFYGWQLQPEARTVQGEIEGVLEELCRRRVQITGSGRTDSGVHALGQVAHADIRPEELERVTNGLPAMLPDDVAVTRIDPVLPDFHARYDAVSRLYRYRIEKEKHPLTSRYAFVLDSPLDLNTGHMQTAASYSLGNNDWKAMAKEGSSNSDWMVNVLETSVTEDQAGWTFTIRANRFLRGMVRIWTGTLLKVGTGSAAPGLIRQLLENRDRSMAGTSLPGRGLVLLEVVYG